MQWYCWFGMAISPQPLGQITWPKNGFVAKGLYFVCLYQSKVKFPQVLVVHKAHHIKVRHCNGFEGHCIYSKMKMTISPEFKPSKDTLLSPSVMWASWTVKANEKEPFKVGCRLIEVIRSLVSSGVTRETRGKGGLGLGAGDSRQERYDMCIVQIKSTVLFGIARSIWLVKHLLRRNQWMVQWPQKPFPCSPWL